MLHSISEVTIRGFYCTRSVRALASFPGIPVVLAHFEASLECCRCGPHEFLIVRPNMRSSCNVKRICCFESPGSIWKHPVLVVKRCCLFSKNCSSRYRLKRNSAFPAVFRWWRHQLIFSRMVTWRSTHFCIIVGCSKLLYCSDHLWVNLCCYTRARGMTIPFVGVTWPTRC